jgi:acetyl esterase/lipase
MACRFFTLNGLVLVLIGMTGFGCNVGMPNHTAAPAIVSLWPTPPGTSLEWGEVLSDRNTHGHLDRIIRGITTPTLRVFLPENADPNRPACIICPGGGYGILAIDKEGDDVARMLCQHGMAAFVLVYRLPDGSPQSPDADPPPIADVHRAIRMVREGAKKWNIDPARIGIMGFSAGGHLASIATTHFDSGNLTNADPVEHASSRPDFSILIYPVISMHDPVAHTGSRHNLLGKTPTTQQLDYFSADQNITKQTPPMFLVHAEDDKAVPIQNSLRMVEAASKAGVPCELVLLKTGGHGFGMGVNGGEATEWPSQCIEWMRARQILSK